VVFGQLVSEEGDSRYWHLYMNVGDSTKSVDLTPGATAGALYDGMTADGTSVYFTTTDALTSDDHDTSADLYSASVSAAGTVTLTRVSTGSGGTGDTNFCDPAANTVHAHWNTVGSSPNCDVVAVGGGGGVASGDGTVYFLSPETLDGASNGVPGAPNLYVARPGAEPQFVATLESTLNAPAPAARHPFRRETGEFEKPAGVAIEHSTGDIYVFDIENTSGSGNVQKFDENGHPVLSFGENGKLIVPGVIGLLGLPTELALEQSTGDLFVPDLQNGAIHKYDSDGNPLQTISIPDFVSGVAVDQTNGRIYATGYGGSTVYEFAPNGTPITEFPTLELPTGVAVNSTGTVYVVNGGGQSNAKGTTEAYTSTGTDLGQFSGEPSNGVAVDPSDDHVFVSKRNQVVEYDSAGNTIGEPSGEGILVGAISLAADSGRIAVSNPGQGAVTTFEPLEVPSIPTVDNPLVVDSVGAPGTRRTEDFQVTPSGNDAIFTSTLPLTEYDSGGHEEVYRFDANEGLACASCNPTGEQAVSDATLVHNGSDLSADGRVFFDTGEGLVDRDLNERTDAYEWEPEGLQVGEGIPTCRLPAGCVGLISAGTSPFDAGLLGVSEDGLDAYFFSRDKLVEEDENGNNMHIYDARVLGGVPFVPLPVQCKASDECHGPSTPIPPAPNIKTLAGTPIGNHGRGTGTGCKSGFVRKHGKCVKKKKKHGKSSKRTRRRGR
jgi:sugar lactone lactonase YvrE